MTGNFHFAPNATHNSRAVDQEGGALHSHVTAAIHALFHPNAIGLSRLGALVGRELHRKSMLRLEFVVRNGAVPGNPNNDRPFGLEFPSILAEGDSFGSAPRGIVLRVEIEHHRFALKSG